MSDHPIRVLLIEDNPADARLLRELLREASAAGYAVTWADRLATGLARLAADAPDVVFLDLSLPDSQGLATFRALRGQAPAAPIIVLTGLDDDALALAAVHEGAQDYLVKGQVDSNLLGRAIRYAIERQQTQARLLEERNLLRTLIDNLPDSIFFKDTESRIVIDNEAHRRLLGATTLDQVVGKRDADFFAPELADSYTADEQRVIRTGEPLVNREEPTLDPVGTPRWLLTTKAPLRDQWGRVSGIVGISHDITGRKQAEEALRRSALRLEMLHQVDQAILTARPLAALVQLALEGLRRLVSCRSASVVLFDPAAGADTLLAVQADDETATAGGTRITTEAPLIAILQRGEVRLIEDLDSLAELPPALRGLCADGVRSLSNVPLLADGELLGMLTLTWKHRGACSPEQVEIAREVADQLAIAIRQGRLREQVARHTAELEQRVADRTAELRAANDKLKELDRFKSSFVSDVSHELRQPLTNIKTYLYLLDRGKPEKRAGYLATLQRETDLLQQLIEDLLHLSRIDLGKAQPVLAPLDINRLVGTLVEDRGPLAAEHDLALHTALAPDLPAVMADAKMVTQVLTNLLANAMNYTPRGGTIVVSTAARQDGGGAGERGSRGDTQHAARNTPTGWVTFSVSDTGPGIAAEEQTRIFERFYRGEAARVSRAPGTGLGLAICQELIRRHKGKITLESQIGQGSTFTVWLPAADGEWQIANSK
ncbi:MAG: ATP-binding protein [Chloroflexi bacterium]|nr:ATP-binding protein [Chloroflexota bacterium]